MENIKCTFCDGVASEKTEKIEVTFKGNNYQINQHYYKCEKCSEEFTTNEMDDKSLSQLKFLFKNREKMDPKVSGLLSIIKSYGFIKENELDNIITYSKADLKCIIDYNVNNYHFIKNDKEIICFNKVNLSLNSVCNILSNNVKI